MSWFGKLAGGALGFLMGGPLGAALGAAFGHQWDQSTIDLRRYQAGLTPELVAQLEPIFFRVLFQMMGFIAKADGLVSEAELTGARAIMNRMALNEAAKLNAMYLFNEGKQPLFELEAAIASVRKEKKWPAQLSRLLVLLLTESALANGQMHPEKEAILLVLCDQLVFSRYEYFGLRARLQTEQRLGGFRYGREVPPRGRQQEKGKGDYSSKSYDKFGPFSATPSLEEAYALLDLPASAPVSEIKRAYRRAISRNHPDKLTAGGASPEEILKATRMTQKIQKAYEAISRARFI